MRRSEYHAETLAQRLESRRFVQPLKQVFGHEGRRQHGFSLVTGLLQPIQSFIDLVESHSKVARPEIDPCEFQIAEVDSGEDALRVIGDIKPDIVLLDIMMPGLNGYEVCKKMRADPSLAKMKIIMVSARAYEEERKKGLEAGADDYITKPFSVADIKKAVENSMAGS